METVTSMLDVNLESLERDDWIQLASVNQLVAAVAARLVIQLHHVGDEQRYASHLVRYAERAAESAQRARDCLFRTIGNGATEATWFESTRGNWS